MREEHRHTHIHTQNERKKHKQKIKINKKITTTIANTYNSAKREKWRKCEKIRL